MRNEQNPLNPEIWKRTPLYIRIKIAWLIYKSVTWLRWRERILRLLVRVDLWFFPPLMFYGAYLISSRYLPIHPIRLIAINANAFMAASLSLFLLRPATRYKAHWIH